MAQSNQPRANGRLSATHQRTALPCITELTLQTGSPISGSTGAGGGSPERRRRGGVLARGGFWVGVVLCGVAACGGDKGTGPSKGTLSDPANTKAQLQAVAAPFTTPAFESFAGLSLYFTPPAAAPGVTALIRATLPRGPTADAQPYAKSVLHARALANALLGNPITTSIFPTTGTTYVWDPNSLGYVASSLTGAPSNGIRFIIYTLSGGYPAVPLNANGYVDFTDRSTATATILGITLVATSGTSAVTYADYTITGSFSTTSFSLALAGYVSDGTTRVDFSLTYGGTATAFSFETTMDVPAAGVHIAFSETFTEDSPTTATSDGTFSIAIGQETVAWKDHFTVLLQSPYTTTGTAELRVNGALVASWSFDQSGSTITYSKQLTPAEQDAITQVFLAASDIFTTWSELLYPAFFYLVV